ncbi:MAG: hypothetical protein JST63_06185 [Bacteroidetes bacterium]|nr:hypothetical protein [Bacteroidota bacterium]
MKPKQLLPLLLLLIFSSSVFAQNENAFASIGKKGKVLTLTKGQYNETFDADSIQQIGSTLINIRTMKVVKLLTDDESKKRLEGERHSRFLSVDPLASGYPMLTPYQFAGNSPIMFIDLDGLEPKKGEINYGKNIIFGKVNEKAIEDKFLLKNKYNLPKRTNENWLGYASDIVRAAEMMTQFVKEGTTPQNVVFQTHGNGGSLVTEGIHKGQGSFIPNPTKPANSNDNYSTFTSDIQNYIKGDVKNIPEVTLNSIKALETILTNIQEGGNFILSGCNIADDKAFGAALQQLGKGKVNIYISYDFISLPANASTPELDWTKIANGKPPRDKANNDFIKGFALFPAGFEQDGTTPKASVDLNANMTLQSQNTPVKLATETPKK